MKIEINLTERQIKSIIEQYTRNPKKIMAKPISSPEVRHLLVEWFHSKYCLSQGDTVSVGEVRASYCESHGSLHPFNPITFSKTLTEAFPTIRRGRKGDLRAFVGIRARSDN